MNEGDSRMEIQISKISPKKRKPIPTDESHWDLGKKSPIIFST